ncbi:MAG TPA: DUF2851 family protein [Bacteroidia bacterium]|nr:DUF2851 family protein [Bacteroidia bacterium]
MTEDFLHYIWKHRLYKTSNLETTGGEKISVEHPGTHNTDAGPDFFNARIKIDSTLWAGNVEIHQRSSDWQKHLHHNDKEYDNIILHVVEEHDEELKRKDNSSIPTLELKGRIEKLYIENYERLINSRHKILCEKQISSVGSFTVNHWLERMLVERLERKSKDIFTMLKQNKNNWEETFYFLIARNFGFKLNAQPFEELARSLPLSALAKHRNDLPQIEAMLFGQAGMLEKRFTEEYPATLKKEFAFLNSKFKFENKVSSPWKFLRLRPANFPTIRIAQYAQLVHRSSHLFSKILECTTVKQVKKLFDISVSDYWKSHYTFEKKSQLREKHLGEVAVENIIINTVAPLIFSYGMNRNDELLKERAMKFLEQLSPEKNSIITKWESLGIEADNSFRSQALLELFNEYCTKKKCLTCGIGNKLISAKS